VGIDWGIIVGQPAQPFTAPINWLVYVNLPRSYWGVDKDSVAPAGYLHDISTVGGLPANLVAIDPDTGNVRAHPENEWLEVTAGTTDFQTGWHGTDVFQPTAGRSMIFELHYTGGTQKIIIGAGSGTGIARADFTNAIEIDAGTIKVLHDPGTGGQTSRTYTSDTLRAGFTYRFRITWQVNGAAYYEMQTNYTPTDQRSQPIGARFWHDLLQGTAPGTGAGIADLRMKGSSGTAGTSHLVAWPRIAETHAGATNAPGWLLYEDFQRRGFITGYPTNKLHGAFPKAQAYPFAFSDSSGQYWYVQEYGEAAFPAGSVSLAYLRVADLGAADIDATFTFTLLSAASSGWPGIRFNWDSVGNTFWQFVVRPDDGFTRVIDPAGNPVDSAVGALPEDGTPIRMRVRTLDDLVQAWIDKGTGWVQVCNQSFSGRANKTARGQMLASPDINEWRALHWEAKRAL
jgi:hypothetical protein